jgi:cysteinyl-tRNA synthetase
MTISLYNTLTRRKEAFTPDDAKNVRMYVCGPTVYDRPHIGNARSVVVYDVLCRLLMHVYGKEHVTYVRNITDVDDKINARAKERNIPIQALTQEVTAQFHADMDALGCLRPSVEPRATEHIAEMIAIITKLLENKHAYLAQNHVMFDVASVKHYAPAMGDSISEYVYGMLSHRVQDDLVAGARVGVEAYKKSAGDFVLWKPAGTDDDASSVFDSPWGKGRPGWHIECSAMSSKYLGDSFDLHGGGADLMFPHHENEIAQSRCANPASHFAKYWVHNGFLTVNGEKMSKSVGNFITVHDLLEKGVKGEVIRYALLSTKYGEPLDWNEKLLDDAKKSVDKFYRIIDATPMQSPQPHPKIVAALSHDLNTAEAFAVLHSDIAEHLKSSATLLGICQYSPEEWFKGGNTDNVDSLIAARATAKKSKNFAEADRIRKELADQGIILEDRPDGTTGWRRA